MNSIDDTQSDSVPASRLVNAARLSSRHVTCKATVSDLPGEHTGRILKLVHSPGAVRLATGCPETGVLDVTLAPHARVRVSDRGRSTGYLTTGDLTGEHVGRRVANDEVEPYMITWTGSPTVVEIAHEERTTSLATSDGRQIEVTSDTAVRVC
ncbi:hypothetical protein B8281_16030 [Cellulosimicrobium sp. TH-20]|uniref:hypothetical protein n=1 Tax=Cellulosimicrobium sp. TH-20 TaxID=1980001 RepID=UPI000A17AA19|nr:hypothetical protein [Cellulosimicrobium sp. TH-20]ARK06001.1 hypothetical protein B8281_16030 [Cellulosimicrobium sp. TH-20]